jgi:hypothetical protein
MSKTKTATVRTVRKSNTVSISEKKLLAVEDRLGKCLNSLQDLIRDSENGTLSPIQIENRGRKILNSLYVVLDPIQDEINDAYMRSSSR